jgi:GDP/UDP-N,N'-diacetylbacillosamine 2-epimerase (hydrolysing)
MKKICIITGSRAEYGLLKPLLEKLKMNSCFELQIVVTGTHLSNEFGLTYKEIEQDGFTISEKIESTLSSDTPISISKSIGLVFISFAEVYARLKPDLIVVMGDRYEIFAAVASAHVSRIRVAHLSGGEVTIGAMDEAFRHSITKMSQLHFTSTEEYRKRVIQLGEDPESVFNVGEIGLDNIRTLSLLTKDELKQSLGLRFNKRNLLVTFHPVTLDENTSSKQFENILTVLENQKDTNLILTKTNADTNGRIINEMIDNYVSKNSDTSFSFSSLGRLRYLSLLQFVDAVVGNSSSGIVEAPSFKIGTINIGDRQKGRVEAQSVIDCECANDSIKKALNKLYSSKFRELLKSVKNPYYAHNSAEKIKKYIVNYLSSGKSIKKEFFDLEFSFKEEC